MRILPPVHQDEFYITFELVWHLLKSQVPWLADSHLRTISPGGTDHVMVRIGEAYVARLPRHPGASPATTIERQWLPIVNKTLTIETPRVVYAGSSDDLYRVPWSILSFIHGRVASPLPLELPTQSTSALAQDLAKLVTKIRSIPIPERLSASELPKSYRTQSLSERDLVLHHALGQCDNLFDEGQVLSAWEADKRIGGRWDGPLVAAHGDLQPSNLILDSTSHRLVGVIDWGGLSFGDPAVDLLPAWMLLNTSARQIFRRACGADDLTWRRGRAWALSIGIIAFSYYRISRPEHAAISRRQVEQVLLDFQTDTKQ